VLRNDRFRRAVRGVWEHSHATYVAWSDEQRAGMEPAIEALLTWLADAHSEGDLIERYWEAGDPSTVILEPALPAGTDPEDALTVQGEGFWRRLTAIEADPRHA